MVAHARTLMHRGPRLVIVTRGARGVSAYMEERIVNAAARSATVVDTVGAGDTFNAGVLAALHRRGLTRGGELGDLNDSDLMNALEFASAAAAITVSRAGANPPWRDELPPS